MNKQSGEAPSQPAGAEAPASPYDRSFFEESRKHARTGAERIVPLVMSLVRPGSVLDVGCGTGTWLSVFEQHGVSDYVGIDGDHVERSLLEIPDSRFVTQDLDRPVDLGREFDLVASLEVAEHLSDEASKPFVDFLCRHAPVGLFSAAIPHQGGFGHINEQWPEYWVERFAARGYVPVDCIRSAVWDDEEVAFWYSQNAMLFVRRDRLEEYPALADTLATSNRGPLHIVHPRLFLMRAAGVKPREYWSAPAPVRAKADAVVATEAAPPTRGARPERHTLARPSLKTLLKLLPGTLARAVVRRVVPRSRR